MTKDDWGDIPEYEGRYSISKSGVIRSYSKYGRSQIKGRKLKGGHHRVALYKDGVAKDYLVHRLVLMAFVGPCPDGMEALHWDDDKDNNNLSNLRWGTRSDNQYDRVRNGNHPQANKTHCKHNHPFDEVNTALENRKGGVKRVCKTCRRGKDASRRARSRGE